MFEALVAVAATTGLLAVAKGHTERAFVVDPRLVVDLSREDGDLPCPWCRAPTSEADPRCPTCDRRFG